MIFLISVCLLAFLLLLWLLRRDRVSLGIPIAYLGSLLLIHVPGTLPHILNPGLLYGSEWTEIGIQYVAIGAVCFVGGVWLARSQIPPVSAHPATGQKRFWLFCLVGGWLVVYVLSPLHNLSSVGAVVDEGGAIWLLGVMLGLRAAIRQGNLQSASLWFGALMVYPVLMLLLGGFLSYGSAAVIIVCSALTVSVRSYGRMILGLVGVVFLGLSLFVSYFQHRDAIRNEVWGGAPIEDRVGSVRDMVADFKWFDPTDEVQASALDQRLNQNNFVGLAAQRLEQHQVDYLYGRSISEALLALVPRAIWPEKPVFAGSPKIVSEMTGLQLSPTTSFGVGNVMEFQINFGLIGVIFGFLGLGWLIGTLDRRAAIAERRGDLGKSILYFLPAVALIHPEGSMVEMAGGGVSALLAAYGWKWLWERLGKRIVTLGKPILGRVKLGL